MLTAKQVADYILSLSDPDEGDIISHLKLQKLLYYAQGFHLAVFNEPLFSEEILAWDHGPVVEALYHEYKSYGARAISLPDHVDFDAFTEDQKELLNEVYTVYGQYSAWKLRAMTHEEPPWAFTPRGTVISHESMKKYFKAQLVDT